MRDGLRRRALASAFALKPKGFKQLDGPAQIVAPHGLGETLQRREYSVRGRLPPRLSDFVLSCLFVEIME
jgi:hypothetical protein